MENSKIEWCAHTFNMWRGCTKVSAGCANCYAETQSKRNLAVLGVWGPKGTRVVAAESQWKEPLRWQREAAAAGVRARVFCASFADVFEDWRADMTDAKARPLLRCAECGQWRAAGYTCHGEARTVPLTMAHVRRRLLRLIGDTPNLDWLLLTKRPENVLRLSREALSPELAIEEAEAVEPSVLDCCEFGEAFPNVWLGTSVEDQQVADARIPHLLGVPARVRFLSCEPLLGPVDLRSQLENDDVGFCNACGRTDLLDEVTGNCRHCGDPRVREGRTLLSWVIVGGESGPRSRPMHREWADALVQQCRAAAVPVFVKQLGACYADAENGVCGAATAWPFDALPKGPTRRLTDAKGGDIDEFPEPLKVREFPCPTNPN